MEQIEGVLLRVAEDRESVNWDWSKRCSPFVGTWTPADHVYFLHGTEDVKQDHYVTIARSNAHGLQNDVGGAFEAELKEDNQRRYQRELREYEVAQADGRKMRKPRLQSNINWVQDSIRCCQTNEPKHQYSFDEYFYEGTSERHSVRAASRLSLNVLLLEDDLCELNRL